MARISPSPGRKALSRATTTFSLWMSSSKETVQLTANEGRNENPSWAPDGAHIVYASKRGRQSQIWVMNADGTGKHSLTQTGSNEKPVWVNAEK